jgi:hypothetical protein
MTPSSKKRQPQTKLILFPTSTLSPKPQQTFSSIHHPHLQPMASLKIQQQQ